MTVFNCDFDMLATLNTGLTINAILDEHVLDSALGAEKVYVCVF